MKWLIHVVAETIKELKKKKKSNQHSIHILCTLNSNLYIIFYFRFIKFFLQHQTELQGIYCRTGTIIFVLSDGETDL